MNSVFESYDSVQAAFRSGAGVLIGKDQGLVVLMLYVKKQWEPSCLCGVEGPYTKEDGERRKAEIEKSCMLLNEDERRILRYPKEIGMSEDEWREKKYSSYAISTMYVKMQPLFSPD